MRKLLGLCFGMIVLGVLSSCQSNSTNEDGSPLPQNDKQSSPKKHPAAMGNKGANVHTNVDGRTTRISTAHLDAGGMNWLTMDQASSLKNTEGKKFLVDVYTDWCGWCKVMDKKTFSNPEIKEYLQENYHLVKFNAEQTDPISFKNKTYKWSEVGRNGINLLTIELLGNQLSYPTLVYFDERLEKITSRPGYKTPDQLLAELMSMDN